MELILENISVTMEIETMVMAEIKTEILKKAFHENSL